MTRKKAARRPEPELVNRRTLALRLGVCEKHISNMEPLGLPVERYGHRVLYDYAAVRRWAQARAAEHAAGRGRDGDSTVEPGPVPRRRRATPRNDATSEIADEIRGRIGTKKRAAQ